MNVDVARAVKPLRKLRKILQNFPSAPAPEEVHDLRTRTRRLEAVVHALSPDSDRDAKRLLKLVKPVRKAAGKVRDMDVFIARLHEISPGSSAESLVRLTEHVAGVREKHVAQLRQVVARKGKQARRCIRQYVRMLESSGDFASPAAPQILAAELDHWPKLDADNLHEFRIKAKELRYMLQLLPGVDQQRMEALDQVKDAAGEWHDWLVLQGLAGEILDAEEDRELLAQFTAITREKLRAGLTAANQLRKLSLEIPQAA